MKTLFLLLSFSFLIPSFLFGQNNEKAHDQKFEFQLVAGMTIAKRNVQKDYIYEYLSGYGIYKEEISKPGFKIGADVNYYISKWFGLGTGLSVTNLKYSTQLDLTKLEGYNFSKRQTLNYINLPFYIFFTYPVCNFSPYIKTGIMYSRLINASVEQDYRYTDTRENRTYINEKPKYVTKNYFYLIAIGSKLKVKKSSFSFEVSYQKGLKNIYNEEERYSHFPMPVLLVDVPDDFTVDYFQFSFGWIL
jgi:hypothetical protein